MNALVTVAQPTNNIPTLPAFLELERERCRRSAHHFIFDCGKLVTKDEHKPGTPVKTFPNLPYLRSILDCLLVSGRLLEPVDAKYALASGHSLEWLINMWLGGILALEKSRQMLVTWLVCAYLLWRAKYIPHQFILVQSKREDDAANLVFNKNPEVARISFMEFHLPQHLRTVMFPAGAAYSRVYFPGGGQIWAIPEGGDIIRSNTPSVIFADEAAFQPQFGESFTAALPAIKGGGQYIAVSSAEPGEFQELVEAGRGKGEVSNA